jgi:hypothetical protein
MGNVPAIGASSPVSSSGMCWTNVYSMSPERHMRTFHFRETRLRGFKSRIKRCAVVICLILAGRLFGERIASGTIIVMAQTKRYIVVAGDSRGGESDDGITIKSTNDYECKIAALGGNTVFGAAGVIGNPAKKWTAVSVAVDASAPILKRTRVGSIDGDRILENWAKLMLRRLADFSTVQLSAYAKKNEGVITTGILAGVEPDGTAWLHALKLNYSDTGGLWYQGYTMTSNDPPTAYYFLGKSEVGLEFEESKTSKRAILERTRWSVMKLSGMALDRFKAARLVKLTIEFNPDKSEVGGKTDEIELDSKGVRWIALKKNCEQGEATRAKTVRH